MDNAELALAIERYRVGEGAIARPDWLTVLEDRLLRVAWFEEMPAEGLRLMGLPSGVSSAAVLARTALVEQPGLDAFDERYHLLVLPRKSSGGNGVVAVIELAPPILERLVRVGGIGLAMGLGLLGIAIAWLHGALVRPLRQIQALFQGGNEASRSGGQASIPVLLSAAREASNEVLRWRREAAYLRHSTELRIDAKIRKAERELQQVSKLADTDALTGLGNRRLMQTALPRLLEAARQSGDDLSVVLFDINHFKELNDTLGHEAGDEIVTFAGKLLASAIRSDRDVAVRLGGDEFLLILPGVPANEAVGIARRVLALFAQRARTIPRVERRPGLSAGVAGLRTDRPADAETFLRMADSAMYAAKSDKRGVCAYAEIGDQRALCAPLR